MRLEQLAAVFEKDTGRGGSCLEIGFSLRDSEIFGRCFMGRMYDPKRQADICWYGLTPDGKNAYDYPGFAELAAAPVFEGRSLEEVWERVESWAIDGCEPEERLEELRKT